MALSSGLFPKSEAYRQYLWGLGSPAPARPSCQAALGSQREVGGSPPSTAASWRATSLKSLYKHLLFECAISQLAVYEIKNSKWCIHPGFTISKPKTLMQSTLKIHVKKANKQNELCVILYLLGSNNSSTTFNLCTDQQDSWRLAHRHFLAKTPSSQTSKKPTKQKTQNKPQFFKAHTRNHLIECMWVPFWLQLLVFKDLQHWILYTLSLDYNQSWQKTKVFVLFPWRSAPESPPQLTHPSWLDSAEIRAFNSRSCLGSNGWEWQLTWAHISPASRKDQGILSPNRHEILEVFYNDIFKGRRVLGTWLLLSWRLIIPCSFQGLPLLS